MGLWSKARSVVTYIRGHGVEIAKDTWEDEYARGEWGYLRGLDQLARYSVLVGYVSHLKPNAAILDVGCGEGVLQQLLARCGYSRYVGTDLSEQALVAASGAADERTTFVQCDAAQWEPTGLFDVIVFNEVVPYFRKPLEVLRRYESALAPDGFYVVSIYSRAGHTRPLWRGIASAYTCLHETRITGTGRRNWLIRVLARPGATLASISRRLPA